MTTRTLLETLRPYLWDTDFDKLDMLVCCTPPSGLAGVRCAGARPHADPRHGPYL